MSRWIEDPQGRVEVEKVTRFLKLPVWKPQYLGKFREFWNELWEKIDTNAETSALTLSGKEDSFLKNSAFNKDFGVAREQVLEGSKLAEILGIQYGGLLNNNTTKKRGLGYYCTVNESIYKCKEDTQLNYAESNYFDAISNDDLLGKLQNLGIRNNIEIVASTNIPNGVLQIIRTRMGNIAYFTAMATTNNSTFEHIKVDFKDIYCRYRVLSSTSYAEDGNDLSIGLTGDESNSNIVTASIRRMGTNQPPAMVCKVMLVCEIL